MIREVIKGKFHDIEMLMFLCKGSRTVRNENYSMN
jgi:hypothetical protein